MLRGLSPSCSAQASRCSGFSCRGRQAVGHTGSAVAAPGPESTGSVVLAHGLICFSACGIFPDQVSILCLLHWQADCLPLIHQGSPQINSYTFYLSQFVFLHTESANTKICVRNSGFTGRFVFLLATLLQILIICIYCVLCECF